MGAFGSFFTGGGAAEALGACEDATDCQSTESAAESVMIDAPIDAMQRDMMVVHKCQLTEPVLNFPKNDIISSSYAGQTTNAPRARCDKLCSLCLGSTLRSFLTSALFSMQGQTYCLNRRRWSVMFSKCLSNGVQGCTVRY